jgi:energy-coupling factor transporter ATP-binding protein EcfA2
VTNLHTVIVYGPPGCGKSRYIKQIAKILGMPEKPVFDEWADETPSGRPLRFHAGHLHLTSLPLEQLQAFNLPGYVDLVPFEHIRERLGTLDEAPVIGDSFQLEPFSVNLSEGALRQLRQQNLRDLREEAGDSFEIMVDIAMERHRQMTACGYGRVEDDDHKKGELAAMAAAYGLLSTGHDNPAVQEKVREDFWPWKGPMPTHHSRRELLVTAAALLVAEIERLDRATPTLVQEG